MCFCFRQLLGTEEESSDRFSSDEDDDKTAAWNITREQLNYYTTQFFSMQPNPRGVIRGETAKEFFEKSRLPITELRKIWQLSDVTKDGSLSMEEFLTAMHLVVLRRNNIALPEELPPCLQPMNLRNRLVDRHNKDLYSSEGRGGTGGDGAGEGGGDDEGGGEQSLLLSEDTDAASNSGRRQSSPLSPSGAGGRGTNSKSPSSVISSPGGGGPGTRSKPVNFDFRDARRNPNIIQPVPIRHSPESPVIPTSDDDGAAGGAAPSVKQGRREVIYEQLWNQEVSAAEESVSSLTLKSDGGGGGSGSGSKKLPRVKSENSTDEEDIDDSTEVDGNVLLDDDDDEDASPGSLSKYPLPYDGPVSLPQFSDALIHHRRRQSGVKEPSPPLPPPRPNQTTVSVVGVGHTRSSSLDLNSTRGVIPPALPPRQMSTGGVIKGSTCTGIVGRDCRSMQVNITQYRDKNSVIARTINELHQEVSDALEERIALEFQLEQLKSFGE